MRAGAGISAALRQAPGTEKPASRFNSKGHVAGVGALKGDAEPLNLTPLSPELVRCAGLGSEDIVAGTIHPLKAIELKVTAPEDDWRRHTGIRGPVNRRQIGFDVTNERDHRPEATVHRIRLLEPKLGSRARPACRLHAALGCAGPPARCFLGRIPDTNHG